MSLIRVKRDHMAECLAAVGLAERLQRHTNKRAV